MSQQEDVVTTYFEQIAVRLGFNRLQSRISILPNPFICWGIFVFVFDLVVLQAVKELEGYEATFYSNPVWVLQPIMGLLTPFVVVYLHQRYSSVLKEIDVTARTSDPSVFKSLTPDWLRIGFYAILSTYAIWVFTIDMGINTITQVGGISEFIGVAIVLPFGYGIIFAEFLATYIGLLIFFPRKIRKTDFKINFLDPERLGGLRPVGEIMKVAYYFVVIGLIGYAVIMYGPSILGSLTDTPYPETGLIDDLLFTLVWLLAIGTMLYGLSQVHWFMKRTKRRELTKLDRQARELVTDPFDMDTFEVSDEDEFEQIKQRVEYIKNTQEYPTTFTMWVQIFIGLILPKIFQLIISAI